MKKRTTLWLVMLLAIFVAGTALAQDLVIYPAKGQSQQQMEKDKFECYSWAKGQTGFDPMQMPTASSAPPPRQAQGSVAGSAVRGGVGGGLLGAGVGAIAGGKKGAKKGAGIGALTGGVLGGARTHRQQQQDQQAQQQWANQQAGQYAQQRDAYNRAYGACLEGRGYSVK
jgi:hypothetical protein